MTECAGCRYQVEHGQRRPDNVQRADPKFACGNCGAPLCRQHAVWNHNVGWWLCAYCNTTYWRKRERRTGRTD